MDTSTLRISAKSLGQVALPGFCPRCFWFKLKVKTLPFQIFPGIFNTIDSYTKKVVRGWFDDVGCAPPWLVGLGNFVGYCPTGDYKRTRFVDSATGIELTGWPDDVLRCADGSYVIVDYKTAKFTERQDKLYPIYEVQLNGYALIGERVGHRPISDLALLYFEPVTHDAAARNAKHRLPGGMAMDFEVHSLRVPLKPGLVPQLMETARAIYDLPMPPPGEGGCEDCAAVAALVAAAG